MRAARDLSRSRSLSSRRAVDPFLFEQMEEDPHALERLDIRFRWGRYEIQVSRFHMVCFSPNLVIPAHKHSDFEFHFIPRGKGMLTIEEGEYPLHPGMLYLTGPEVVHRQEVDTWERMYELCLHIDIIPINDEAHIQDSSSPGGQWEMSEAEECVRQLNEMSAIPTLDQHNAMNWFMTAWRAWRDRELGAYTTIRQAIIQILLRTCRAYNLTQINAALPSRDMNSYRYRLATQFIRDNYARPLTLEEVAQGLHICGRQLQRIFGEHASETFSGYLERYRLARVCQALLHSEQTVEQLSAHHGFSSGSYLHYVFKKRLGMTPAQYREQQRQGGTGSLPNLRESQ